jgi:hypothetical protein
MAARTSNDGILCTAPVKVLGVENAHGDIEAIELPTFKIWPTAAAGGFVAPTGADNNPRHTAQIVRPLLQLHICFSRWAGRF